MPRATWVNGKNSVEGWWSYYRPSDCFHIILDSKDKITGRNRTITSYEDHPEWGNWKIKKDSP